MPDHIRSTTFDDFDRPNRWRHEWQLTRPPQGDRAQHRTSGNYGRLLHPAAVRPVLARWPEMPCRRRASEARPVVGAKAPLGRVANEMARCDTDRQGQSFRYRSSYAGAVTRGSQPIVSQAAPRRPPLAAQGRRATRGSGVAKRSSADYLRPAQAPLTYPDWIAAAERPGAARRSRPSDRRVARAARSRAREP